MSSYIRRIRRAIGHDLLLMPGAAAVVIDRGRILLQRRVDDGTWGIPGGLMEPGESVRETIIREVKEETGFKIRIDGVVGVYSSPKYAHTYPNGDKTQCMVVVFRCSVVKGKVGSKDGEAMEVEFFNLKKLPCNMPLFYRQAIRDALVKKSVQID